MPALLSFLAPLIPYLIAGLGILAAYFGIKHKGATEERAKQAAAQAKVVEKVNVAISKDSAVDQKVEKQIEEIKQVASNTSVSDDPFRFKF